MKRIFSALKRVLIKAGGLAGGLLVATFLAIGYLIAWRTYHPNLPALGLSVAAIYFLSLAAGFLFPRFFSLFLLVPLSCLGDGNEGHIDGKDDFLRFVATALYFIAVPLMLFGGFFTEGYVYGAGLAALCAFGAILHRTELCSKA